MSSRKYTVHKGGSPADTPFGALLPPGVSWPDYWYLAYTETLPSKPGQTTVRTKWVRFYKNFKNEEDAQAAADWLNNVWDGEEALPNWITGKNNDHEENYGKP